MIDVSLPIHPAMLHGGRKPSIETVARIADGDPYNVSRWLLSAHAGTHVEAPLHTDPDGAPIDALDLDLLVGPARVLDLTGSTGEMTVADLEAAGLREGDTRVLLKTTNSTGPLRESEKADEWVGLAPEAAQLLVDRGVKLLGYDYLTFETPAREATFDAHYVLNRSGVALIESVDLAEVAPGDYELVCLPLKLDAEAAPARVLLLPAREAGAAPIEISVPVGEEMLTWGQAPQKTIVESFDTGHACNVTRWLIGTHTGTHLDAPLHYTEGAETIDAAPVERFVGPARVLDLTAVEGDIHADDLRAAGLQAGDTRVLLKTRNSLDGLLYADTRPDTWVGLAPDAAQLLVLNDVELVGIDFLSIEPPTQSADWETHHILCDAGLSILEVIDLRDVEAGAYELVALPIPLVGAEAAPGRAFLRAL
jgi:arylformamidase